MLEVAGRRSTTRVKALRGRHVRSQESIVKRGDLFADGQQALLIFLGTEV